MPHYYTSCLKAHTCVKEREENKCIPYKKRTAGGTKTIAETSKMLLLCSLVIAQMRNVKSVCVRERLRVLLLYCVRCLDGGVWVRLG